MIIVFGPSRNFLIVLQQTMLISDYILNERERERENWVSSILKNEKYLSLVEGEKSAKTGFSN